MMAAGDGRPEPGEQVWRDVVRVRSRYRRSVHLERDAGGEAALDDYLLTPLVRTLTGRIVRGLPGSARAWSITGPYGTGKSAFALFLAELLGPPGPRAATARRLLERGDAGLAAALAGPRGILADGGGLLPILATGERLPLDQVLLLALRKATQGLRGGAGAQGLAGKVAALTERAAGGQGVPARDIVSLFEHAAREAAKLDPRCRGLLVLLDEAGKVLEHAAHHPEHGDVQLLQELAEAASRSGDSPIVLVVVLHQAIEQYASRLGATQRGEWAKVQGRFEDLAFQGASDELLRLAGEALERKQWPRGIQAMLSPLMTSCARLAARDAGGGIREVGRLLEAALPLHPVTALLLGPLFRSRLAQHERSLFAFLVSGGPFGFQEHLGRAIFEGGLPALLLPDTLHDHVTTALGGRLYGPASSHWAQVETALARLPRDAGALDARLLKTIGLLGVFGDAAGIAASEATLETIYTDGSDGSRQALFAALERLRRASLIVHRRHRGAYQLREGSDLDVDALVLAAPARLDAPAQLVRRLALIAPPPPLVARRHLFQTGTFRYLDLRYIDAAGLEQAMRRGSQEAPAGGDGQAASGGRADPHAAGSLLVVIEADTAARGRLLQRLAKPETWAPAGHRPMLVAVPCDIGRLLELGGEVAGLEWVSSHTPDLQGDAVARREVAMRLAEAERLLRGEVARILRGDVPRELWSRDGQHDVGSTQALLRLVSDLCDTSYSKSPVMHNELLNRRRLSATAAGARRALVDAMTKHAGEPGLGIEGAPPEMSMYRSLMEHHGLHRERAGRWGFGAPFDRARGSLRPVWAEIERTLKEGGEARLPVTALFERLREPPYGLGEGVLPVLLVAALLAFGQEIALYEDGAFVPSSAGPELERLLRDPRRFEVQRFSVTGPRAALLRRLGELTPPRAVAGKAPGALAVVRRLVRRVAGLTDFARSTRTISTRAQAVREALLRAREPGRLLFHDLPVACEVPPFGAEGELPAARVDVLVERLRGAMGEIEASYTILLHSIEEAIRGGLHLPAGPTELRRELAGRAGALLPVAVDAQLKAFLLRARGDDGGHEGWLVSIGTLLGGKPPASWQDGDIAQMRLSLGLISRRFAALESLLVGSHVGPAAAPGQVGLLRIAVTQAGYAEQERVVALRPAEQSIIGALCSELRAVANVADPSKKEVILTALALTLREEIAALNGRDGGAAEGFSDVRA